MATKKILLFVEGDSDTTNGNLRQGLAVALLKLIDPHQLEKDFQDFDKLITRLLS